MGGSAFSCQDTYTDLGTSGATAQPLDFRLYVHDVKLLSSSGQTELKLADNDWQSAGAALLDFEDASGTCKNGTPQTNGRLRGSAPPGDYTGIAFTVGVPEELNHDNPAQAPSPLNVTALHWNWNGGYKFMRLDMMVMPPDDGDDAGAPMGIPYNFHLGSTLCVGDAPSGEEVKCDNPNRPSVELGDFAPEEDSVLIDYAELVADDDLEQDQGGRPGCMTFPGDPDCPAVLSKLGIDYESGQADGSQRVFRVE